MDLHCVECKGLHHTDALPHPAIKFTENEKSISKDGLARVERDLDEYEKVSVLFLIAADDPSVRQKVLEICENIRNEANVITKLVQNDVNRWSGKLLEALCVVNNREILKKLGFSPRETVDGYLPNVPRYTAKIHAASKVLYNLFETMDEKSTKLLLRYIYTEDGLESPRDIKAYLELHALHWLCSNYIAIHPGRGADLSKLFKHLKKMGYCDKSIYHDVEHFSSESGRSVSTSAGISPPSCRLDIKKVNGPPDMREIQKGKCVIINQENFTPNGEIKYERRDGTKTDSENLRRTFTGLGFDIEELDDLTRDAIFKELTRVSENFDKKIYDCLVVIILSHGYEGGIISADSREISIKDIDNAVCTLRLRDIVKILIVQACQGEIIGNGSQNSVLVLDGPAGDRSKQESDSILRYRCFARFMSTMNGFSAIRHKEKGSWFILDVCEVLSGGERISVLQWQMRVIGKTRSRFGRVNNCPVASQIPEFTSRLEVDVIFPRYDKNRVIETEKTLR